MKNSAVIIRDLTRRFGKFTAVDRVSLEVCGGEIFAFLGPNGAGKSTTIKMLTGLLKPSSGAGSVNGFDINREAEKIKKVIGYMSQRFSLYIDLTPEENLIFFGGIYKVPRKVLIEKMEKLFDTTPIGRSRKSITKSLPAGLKQRLALECAMLHNPPILFLDEPTAGVDPMARRDFWDIIYNASRKGTTVFLTTHYMDEAEHADRVAMIFSGKLRALNTPSRLKADFTGGNIFRLDTDELTATMYKLTGKQEVNEVTIFGSCIHLIMQSGFDLDLTRNYLDALGISYTNIQTILTSLEDVFISLTRQEV
jgi:drug efflux transport system ATP-binding protein